MTRFLLTVILCFFIAACQNVPQTFASMSEEEVYVYNLDKPVMQKVHCVREAETSTHIRKRICRTVEDWVEYNNRAAMTLDVLNVPGGGGLPDFIDDGPQR